MAWSLKKTVNSQKTTPRCPGHQEFVTPQVSGTPGSNKFPVSGTPGVKTPRYPGHRESKLPGIPESSKNQLPGVLDTGGVTKSRCPGHQGVVFWLFTVFFKFQAIFYILQSNNQQKYSVDLISTILELLDHVFKIFLTLLFLLQLPVSRTPGSLFKMYITLWKFTKN